MAEWKVTGASWREWCLVPGLKSTLCQAPWKGGVRGLVSKNVPSGMLASLALPSTLCQGTTNLRSYPQKKPNSLYNNYLGHQGSIYEA